MEDIGITPRAKAKEKVKERAKAKETKKEEKERAKEKAKAQQQDAGHAEATITHQPAHRAKPRAKANQRMDCKKKQQWMIGAAGEMA